ncbi:MAG: AI-2E family transporter [Bdellovibrionales bacterium]
MSASSSKVIYRERWIKLASVLSLLFLLGWILISVQNMMASFILAVVITYLLNPFVNLFERQGYSRSLAIIIPYLAGGALVAISISLFYPVIAEQITDLQSEVPKYQSGLLDIIKKYEQRISGFLGTDYKLDLSSNLTGIISSSVSTLFTNIPDLASKIFTVALLAPFFAFFLLRDGRQLARKFLKMIPNNLFELALNLNYQINRQMGDFIRARLLEAAIVGIIIWVGLSLIGFPYASVFAIVAAVTNLIPYIGPFFGVIPPLIVSFVNNEPSLIIFLVAMVFFIAQIIDILFIIPLVVAKIVNLHPVVVIVVIIIGSQVMGITGMIISIPVASALKLSLEAVYDHLINFRS